MKITRKRKKDTKQKRKTINADNTLLIITDLSEKCGWKL